jgi:hypothetical protein
MTDKLSQFEWRISENGYRWKKSGSLSSADEQWHLTDGVPIGSQYRYRVYRPLQEETGLFISFAELKPTRTAILNFSNSHGLLRGGDWMPVADNLGGFGEPLDEWKSEIRAFSESFELWQMLIKRDNSGLARRITWSGTDGVRYNQRTHLAGLGLKHGAGATGRWIAQRHINPDLLESFRQGDVVQPAWYQLQHSINERMKDSVRPRLLWDARRTQLSLYHVPKDLISAIWLQLARAVEGNKAYNQCQQCRNWFEVNSPDGSRSDKKFCTTACRARAWRTSKAALGT